MNRTIKKLLVLFCILLVSATVVSAAEFTATLQVNKGPEADIQTYHLYYGVTESEVVNKTNEAVQIHQGSPADTPDLIRHTFAATVQDNSEGIFYFGVTATDTSGNQSGMSNIVSKKWDFLAPAPLVLSIE